MWRGAGGECLRKNRSLCTSDIFIAHKLGSAPTPACGVQALRWKPVQEPEAGGPCPAPSLTAPLLLPWASGAQCRHLDGEGTVCSCCLVGSEEAPGKGSDAGRCGQPTSHLKPQGSLFQEQGSEERPQAPDPRMTAEQGSRTSASLCGPAPACPKGEGLVVVPGGAAGLKSVGSVLGPVRTLSSDSQQPPPPSSRWSFCQTCRPAAGHPPAPGSPVCSSTCVRTGVVRRAQVGGSPDC